MSRFKQHPRLAPPNGLNLRKTQIVNAIALAFLGNLVAPIAYAQNAVQKVTVTGSSIKRAESETSLPITVITRAQIEQTGATSVEDLLKRVSASAAAVSDTTQGAGYANSNANLRGLGANSTLVLLNGRRLANQAFGNIGGAAAVDLNSIPFAAIERIEVLRDGASAIYGADAVGGVINFITRKNYRNGEVSVRYGDTQAKIGGGEQGATIAAGFGDLGSEGYNLLLTANVQKNTRIRAIDQKYYLRGVKEIPGSDPPSSSAPFPGTISGIVAPGSYPELNSGANFAPCSGAAFVTTNGKTPAGQDKRGCRFVYSETLDNLPDSEKMDLFGRATFKLNEDHQLFVEASYAQNHSIGRIAPTPIKYGFGPYNVEKEDFLTPLMPVTSKYYPRDLLKKLGYVVPDTGMQAIALRAVPAGNRINDNTNSQTRLVIGASGNLMGWDYDAGLNVSKAKGLLNYKGYINEDKFIAALASGNLNPFGPNDAVGDALWKSAAMEGDMRQSTSTTTEIDFRGSRELMQMNGGAMGLALGVNLRKEKADDNPLNPDYAAGKHIGGEGTVPATQASRTLKAVFGELSVPFAKGWEATLAARFDSYSDFGNSFNPRIALRYQPSNTLMFRASTGTGFRAPTLWDVNSPVSFSNTADSVSDSGCPVPGDDRCETQLSTRSVATPGLKPETSRQFTAGVVFEPIKGLSVTLDYWNISKKDQIGVIAADTLVPSKLLQQRYGSRIKRNAEGFIKYVETPVDNLGELKTSGIDIDVRSTINLNDLGKLNLGFGGTYVNQYDSQKYAGGAFDQFAGTGGDATVPPIPRWQHTASAEWVGMQFGVTLEHVFTKGWTESAASVNGNVGVDAAHKVKDSSRFNLIMTYKAIKNLTLRVGIRNLFDTEPPFVASSSYGSHASGYAASFTDPRGRFFYTSLGYQFK